MESSLELLIKVLKENNVQVSKAQSKLQSIDELIESVFDQFHEGLLRALIQQALKHRDENIQKGISKNIERLNSLFLTPLARFPRMIAYMLHRIK